MCRWVLYDPTDLAIPSHLRAEISDLTQYIGKRDEPAILPCSLAGFAVSPRRPLASKSGRFGRLSGSNKLNRLNISATLIFPADPVFP